MDALLLVDLQYDFMPGGPLGVPQGNEVIPVANALIARFELVVASQDWHPPDHASFAVNHPGREPGEVIDLDGLPQVLWPVHCVQETRGAELVSDLRRDAIGAVFRKGTHRTIDSYSAFFDNAHQKSTGLGDSLSSWGVRRVFLMGLATDYCVLASALDARNSGFETVLVEAGCRGVELSPGDSARALERMREAGVRVLGTVEEVSLSRGTG